MIGDESSHYGELAKQYATLLQAYTKLSNRSEKYRKALEDIKHFNRDEGETDLNIILKMWAVAIGALKND